MVTSRIGQPATSSHPPLLSSAISVPHIFFLKVKKPTVSNGSCSGYGFRFLLLVWVMWAAIGAQIKGKCPFFTEFKCFSGIFLNKVYPYVGIVNIMKTDIEIGCIRQ